jgi:hypothetical protein
VDAVVRAIRVLCLFTVLLLIASVGGNVYVGRQKNQTERLVDAAELAATQAERRTEDAETSANQARSDATLAVSEMKQMRSDFAKFKIDQASRDAGFHEFMRIDLASRGVTVK